MKFALLYSYDPTQTSPADEEISAWLAFDQAVKDAGAYVYEAGFYPATMAQTVRVRDGQPTTIPTDVANDGNVVAGLYVVEVADVDAALAWAQRIPTVQYGTVEVRQVVE